MVFLLYDLQRIKTMYELYPLPIRKSLQGAALKGGSFIKQLRIFIPGQLLYL
jgi:hypothetical protein